MDDENFGFDEEKPRGSAGYWVGMIAVAVVFGLGIAFVPSLLGFW